MTVDEPAVNRMILDFVDERYEAYPGDEITFGRAADVILDEGNDFMHRVVGSFVFHQGSWWLQNRSSSTQLSVTTEVGKQSLLPPGTSDPLTSSNGNVRFSAGSSNYELSYDIAMPLEPPRQGGMTIGDARATDEYGVVPLNEEQRAMLVLLAEQWLRNPGASYHDVPANADVAHRLGWSLKKLDRKLDYLCARLSDLGVPGLRGEKGGEASDRRRRLVEHVLAVRLIGEKDLPDDGGYPR